MRPKHKLKSRIHPLEDELDRYLDELREEKRLARSTLEHYEREIRLLFEVLPRPETVDSLKKYLAQKAPATHLRKLIIWRSFLERCREPWKSALMKLRSPKLRQKQPIFLTEDEAFRIEAACYKTEQMTRDRLFVAFALQMGLRLNEILTLKFKDIEGEWLRILRKGEKEQRLPLTPSLLTLLNYWRTEIAGDGESWIFPGRGPDPMTARAAQLLLKKLAKSCGIEKRITPHGLRHTFATHLAAKGASLAALKEILGHQKIATTERYMHVTPEHLKETMQLVSKSSQAPRTMRTDESH